MDQTPQFARLVKADIRTAWPHEALNFTPWLLQNLDGLSQAVGIPLEPEDSEVRTGTFCADILARNSADDSRVLIENQLAGSDHGHLGQIMTYLAGLEAKTIIWVAADFRDEHLSALKWLNEHTDEQFAFFAIQVKVVQIGDSPFAPIFDVLERPNNWERQLHAAANSTGARSELSERRHSFWKDFVERIPGELERSGPAGFASNRERALDVPRVNLSVYPGKDSVGIFIKKPRRGSDEETKRLLESKEVELTAPLGVPMGPGGWFFFGEDKKGDYTDPAQREELINWLALRADHYESVLRDVFEQV